jgi:hypothetical protein
VVLDPQRTAHRHVVGALRVLDWLARFRVQHEAGARLTVIDRDGMARTGSAAVVFVASRFPVSAFVALPLLLLPANRAKPTRVLVCDRT